MLQFGFLSELFGWQSVPWSSFEGVEMFKPPTYFHHMAHTHEVGTALFFYPHVSNQISHFPV